MTPPPLFVFTKVSSLGPEIKRFNRDVIVFLKTSGQEFSEAYSVEELEKFRAFAPDPIVVERGVPRISELATEFVRVTGLPFGDVYPNLLDEVGLSSSSSLSDLAADDLDEDEENVA